MENKIKISRNSVFESKTGERIVIKQIFLDRNNEHRIVFCEEIIVDNPEPGEPDSFYGEEFELSKKMFLALLNVKLD